jgi:hypothetical protein
MACRPRSLPRPGSIRFRLTRGGAHFRSCKTISGITETFSISENILLCRVCAVHCKENPIYVLPEKKLRSFSPNFHIQVSVSDLFIPTIGLPIFLQQNRQTDRGNIYVNGSQKLNVGIGTEAAQFNFWKYLFRIFGILSLQCSAKGKYSVFFDTNLEQLSL